MATIFQDLSVELCMRSLCYQVEQKAEVLQGAAVGSSSSKVLAQQVISHCPKKIDYYCLECHTKLVRIFCRGQTDSSTSLPRPQK